MPEGRLARTRKNYQGIKAQIDYALSELRRGGGIPRAIVLGPMVYEKYFQETWQESSEVRTAFMTGTETFKGIPLSRAYDLPGDRIIVR